MSNVILQILLLPHLAMAGLSLGEWSDLFNEQAINSRIEARRARFEALMLQSTDSSIEPREFQRFYQTTEEIDAVQGKIVEGLGRGDLHFFAHEHIFGGPGESLFVARCDTESLCQNTAVIREEAQKEYMYSPFERKGPIIEINLAEDENLQRAINAFGRRLANIEQEQHQDPYWMLAKFVKSLFEENSQETEDFESLNEDQRTRIQVSLITNHDDHQLSGRLAVRIGEMFGAYHTHAPMTVAFKVIADFFGMPCRVASSDLHMLNLGLEQQGQWKVIDLAHDNFRGMSFVGEFPGTWKGISTYDSKLSENEAMISYSRFRELSVIDDTERRMFPILTDLVKVTRLILGKENAAHKSRIMARRARFEALMDQSDAFRIAPDEFQPFYQTKEQIDAVQEKINEKIENLDLLANEHIFGGSDGSIFHPLCSDIWQGFCQNAASLRNKAQEVFGCQRCAPIIEINLAEDENLQRAIQVFKAKLANIEQEKYKDPYWMLAKFVRSLFEENSQEKEDCELLSKHVDKVRVVRDVDDKQLSGRLAAKLGDMFGSWHTCGPKTLTFKVMADYFQMPCRVAESDIHMFNLGLDRQGQWRVIDLAQMNFGGQIILSDSDIPLETDDFDMFDYSKCSGNAAMFPGLLLEEQSVVRRTTRRMIEEPMKYWKVLGDLEKFLVDKDPELRSIYINLSRQPLNELLVVDGALREVTDHQRKMDLLSERRNLRRQAEGVLDLQCDRILKDKALYLPFVEWMKLDSDSKQYLESIRDKVESIGEKHALHVEAKEEMQPIKHSKVLEDFGTFLEENAAHRLPAFKEIDLSLVERLHFMEDRLKRGTQARDYCWERESRSQLREIQQTVETVLHHLTLSLLIDRALYHPFVEWLRSDPERERYMKSISEEVMLYGTRHKRSQESFGEKLAVPASSRIMVDGVRQISRKSRRRM